MKYRFLAHLAIFLSSCACLVLPCESQMIHPVYHTDIAVGVAGQFTTSITSQSNVPHQATTDSPGGLFSFRLHPYSWAGVEMNYQMVNFSERFVRLDQTRVDVPLYLHEGTAAYLVQPLSGAVRPFVAVGGGALYFDPSPVHVRTQIRAAGLVSVGVELPVSQHLSFRIQGRSLYYRAPNFNDPSIATSRWVATTEPSASYVIHW